MAQNLSDIGDLRGVMREGYTPDDVNRVFDRIEAACGVVLVCVWEEFDAYGFGGNSQFVVESPAGELHELAGDLWAWLNGDPQDVATPDSSGRPESWIGARTDAAEFACGDGRFNVALVEGSW